MNEVIQYLPEMATSAGVLGGYVVDRLARQHADKTQATVIMNSGPIEGMPTPETIERSFIPKIGDWALKKAPVVVTAVAFGLAPIAFVSQEAPQPSQKPGLELVVDRPAQTIYDGTAPKISTIVKAFEADSKVNVNVILARGGSYQDGHITPNSLENSNYYFPVGAVSLGVTTSVAMSIAQKNVIPVQSNVIGASSHERNVILIDTGDGNPGAITSVLNEAKQDNVEIFVANSGNQTDANALELKAITKETGGQYWDASQNTKAVALEIEKAISPPGEITPVKYNNAWQDWLKVLDISAFIAAAGLMVKTAELVFKRKKL